MSITEFNQSYDSLKNEHSKQAHVEDLQRKLTENIERVFLFSFFLSRFFHTFYF